MKKMIVTLLVIALAMYWALMAYAVAEDTAAAAPMVDITRVLTAAVLFIFDIVLAWIARVIIPPVKAWIEENTTEKQRGLMWDVVYELVAAAEQLIQGPGQGEKRMAYVKSKLRERGLDVNVDMIEAAVRQMNERLMGLAGEALGTGAEPDQNEAE